VFWGATGVAEFRSGVGGISLTEGAGAGTCWPGALVCPYESTPTTPDGALVPDDAGAWAAEAGAPAGAGAAMGAARGAAAGAGAGAVGGAETGAGPAEG
jgi:hypothetical protein